MSENLKDFFREKPSGDQPPEQPKVPALSVAEQALLHPIFEFLDRWHTELNNQEHTPEAAKRYMNAKNQLITATEMFKNKYGAQYPKIANFLDAVLSDVQNWSGGTL